MVTEIKYVVKKMGFNTENDFYEYKVTEVTGEGEDEVEEEVFDGSASDCYGYIKLRENGYLKVKE